MDKKNKKGLLRHCMNHKAMPYCADKGSLLSLHFLFQSILKQIRNRPDGTELAAPSHGFYISLSGKVKFVYFFNQQVFGQVIFVDHQTETLGFKGFGI